MPFSEVKSVRFFQFETLSVSNLKHAILTRRGGVSPSPWKSLNMGGTVGDRSVRVTENMRRGLGAMQFEPESVFDVRQVHSATVATAVSPNGAKGQLRADAIISDQVGLTLMMRFADCVPILAYDPANEAVGIAHAGWLGTVRQISKALVWGLKSAFGSRAGDLIVGIGPSIGPDHYPVGDDVIARVEHTFGNQAAQYLYTINGDVHFDLWSANRAQLEELGVRSIEVSEICTACNTGDWYSHRGEAGYTGRFGALIALRGGR